MAKQLTDTALRVLVARWVKAALGELVEDGSLEEEGEENIATGQREQRGEQDATAAPIVRENHQSTFVSPAIADVTGRLSHRSLCGTREQYRISGTGSRFATYFDRGAINNTHIYSSV